MNGTEVLAVPMDPATNDAQASSIREYLGALLECLWSEQDGFDGKRPFGNSDWVGHLEIALIKAGAVPGEIDEDGYLDRVDSPMVDTLIRAAIAELTDPPKQIRATHRYSYRSGEWAELLGQTTIHLPDGSDRLVHVVRFADDGMIDLWRVQDSQAGYEFR